MLAVFLLLQGSTQAMYIRDSLAEIKLDIVVKVVSLQEDLLN
jgi:hypothetical protein